MLGGEVRDMLFVVTMKWGGEKTPEVAKRFTEQVGKSPLQGVKATNYQLLGRCQSVSIIEAPNEKAIFQSHLPFTDIVECDWAPARLGKMF
jgi:hypothetical protein